MAIKTNELHQPERGMALGNREAGSGETATLQDRLQRAKQQATIEREERKVVAYTKCDCFKKGWLAAIAEIENGTAG